MAIMSEGLPQKLKSIKMGHEERGFQVFLTQPPFVIIRWLSIYNYDFATLTRA